MAKTARELITKSVKTVTAMSEHLTPIKAYLLKDLNQALTQLTAEQEEKEKLQDLLRRLEVADTVVNLALKKSDACEHKNTYSYHNKEIGTDIEACKDCGMSRSVWEQGKSDWRMINLKKGGK